MVAEDPAVGWLPSTGTVATFEIGDGVRVDTGFRAGAVVSADYDSLLAKVIAHAPTRTQAAHTLGTGAADVAGGGRADEHRSDGNVLLEPDFLAAATPTAYLDRAPGHDAAPPAGRRRCRPAARCGVRPGAARPRRRSGARIRPVRLAQPAYPGTTRAVGRPHERRRASRRVRPARSRSGDGPPRTMAAADRRRVAVTGRPGQGRRPPPRSHAGRARWSRSMGSVRWSTCGSSRRAARRRRWWSRAARPERGRSSGRRCSSCTMPTSEVAGRSRRCPAR